MAACRQRLGWGAGGAGQFFFGHAQHDLAGGIADIVEPRPATDDLALAAFEQVVAEEGMATFLDAGNVVPFRR